MRLRTFTGGGGVTAYLAGELSINAGPSTAQSAQLWVANGMGNRATVHIDDQQAGTGGAQSKALDILKDGNNTAATVSYGIYSLNNTHGVSGNTNISGYFSATNSSAATNLTTIGGDFKATGATGTGTNIAIRTEGSTSGTLDFSPAATTTSYSMIFPSAIGSANQALAISSVSGTTATLGWTSLAGSDWTTTGNAGTTVSSSAYGTAANNNFIGTTDGNDFAFTTNGYERMRIATTASLYQSLVGIGTTSPATVDAGIIGNTGTTLNLASAATLASRPLMILDNQRTTAPAAATSAGIISWAMSGYQAANHKYLGYIGMVIDNTTTANQYGGAMIFTTKANGSTTLSERMRIASTGAIAFNGSSNYGTSGQVLTSNGNAPPTWQAALGTGGSGPQLIYPDGTNYSATKFVDYGTTSYTVPANTTLYILQAPLSGGMKLVVDGIVILQANGASKTNAPGVNRFSLAAPIVVGPGSVVMASTTADPGPYASNGTPVYFSGFEITNSAITAVTSSMPSGTPYQVPAGKTLVVMNLYEIIGATISISPDNITWIPFLIGPSNYTSVTSATPTAAQFQIAQILQPLLVPPGYYIRSSDANAYRASFNGYLR